jgi:hypothetical protein
LGGAALGGAALGCSGSDGCASAAAVGGGNGARSPASEAVG